ncbi:MAG: YfhO family protein [Clostridia bacterium]|nr:YfhO family protein [Clostridia bacterium]
METRDNKFKLFCKNHIDSLIVVGVIFVLFNIFFLINGAFPYGNGTILFSDSYYQIGEFTQYVFRVFQGKENLFFTNSLGGNFEVFSTIEYMLLNPFYLVTFFGGYDHIYQMFNISLVLMFMFNALVMIWFTRKHFKNVRTLYRILLTILFTFSAYFLLNYAFVTWLIYPGILILVIDAFIELVKNGKIARFSILMTWYVITSFSVGIFTNLILFLIITVFVGFLIPKNNRGEIFKRVFVGYLFAAIASVIILFPSIMAMMQTSRTISTIGALATDKLIFTPATLNGVVIDFVPLIMFFVYLFTLLKKDRKSSEFKFLITTFAILIFPLIFNLSLNLLNGGVYAGFASRFYFLLGTMLHLTTFKMIDAKQESNVATDSNVKSSKPVLISLTLISIIAVIIVLFWIVTQYDALGANSKSPAYSKIDIFKVFGLIFLAAFLLFAFVSFMTKQNQLSFKVFKTFGICLVVFSTILNCLTFSSNMTSKYNLSEIKEISKEMTQNERVGIKNGYPNDLNFNSENMYLFSSLIPKVSRDAYVSISKQNSVTAVYSKYFTILADSLVGLKYYVYEEEMNRPYLNLIKKTENYYLYENTLASSGAILFNRDFKFDSKLGVYQNFEKLKESFGVSGVLFSEVEPTITELKIDGYSDYKVININYTASEDIILYSNLYATKPNEKDVPIELKKYSPNVGRIETETDCDLVMLSAGETYDKNIVLQDSDYSKLEFNVLNYNVAKALCEKFQENSLEIKKSQNFVSVSGTVSENKNLVVFYVDVLGNEIELNGTKVENAEIYSSFISAELEAGEFTLKATYTYPHLKKWIFVAALGILVIVGLAICYKFTKFKHINVVMPGLFYGVSIAILSIFYLFGLILTFYRIILLI